MGSEISGLDDRHAYLKLGNNVARFDFAYLDLPTPTPGFIRRKYTDGGMSFDPDTLEPRGPAHLSSDEDQEDVEAEAESERTTAQPTADGSSSAPIAHGLKQRPIPWPKEHEQEPAGAGEKNQPAPAAKTTASQPESADQIMVANATPELDGPAFELRP
jgi:hypothetical protein